MRNIKYNKTHGPNVLGLHDMLNKGFITRAEFNRLVSKAEHEDESLKSMSQYERDHLSNRS